jgi:hypothetical protein
MAMSISTACECDAAKARVALIKNAVSDTSDKSELRDLLDAMQKWETAQHALDARSSDDASKSGVMRTDIEPEGIPVDPAVNSPAKPAIHTVEQYKAAARRVQQLTFSRDESPAGMEREALLEAMIAWDKGHDDYIAGRE